MKSKSGTGRRLLILAGAFAGLLALILLYLVWGTGSRSFRGNTSDYNVLLITVDTTRADSLGSYGNGAAQTPAMDRLARTGVLFESAYTPAVMTLPSHASILTGLLPPAHEVRDNGNFRLRPEIETLAEVLRAAGYRTGAAVGAVVLDSMFGLDQGFEFYDDNLPESGAHDTFFAQRPAAAVTDAALAWLGGLETGRWFLWAHYFDPHSPFQPPRPYRALFPNRPYDGEIAYMDAEIGRLLQGLEPLGARDRTIVVLVADHGEGMGDHGEQAHGVFLYDETTRVPMILNVPGFVEGPVRIGPVVRTTDIMPTLLDLLRLPARPAIDGVSLWPLMSGQVEDPGLEAYMESTTAMLTYGWSPMAAIRAGSWKYVQAPRPELYDLAADPRERSNLHQTEGVKAEELRGALERILAGLGPGGGGEDLPGLSPQEQSRLQSLGYAAGGSVSAREMLGRNPAAILGDPGSGLPDPKDRLALLEGINLVYQAYGAGQFEQAIGLARRVLAVNPGNDHMRQYIADSFRQMRRWEEAMNEYETIISRDPANVNAILNIGWVLMNMNDLAGARTAFERALAIHPGHVYAVSSLGDIHFIEGNYGEAASRYREILLERPAHLKSILGLAKIFEQQGMTREAKVSYRRAAELAPRDVDSRLALAWLHFADRELEEALQVLEELSSARPEIPETYLYRGDVYLAMDRLEEAETQYREGITRAPDAAQGYHGLGLVAKRTGRMDEARVWFERALGVNPSYRASRAELESLRGAGG